MRHGVHIHRLTLECTNYIHNKTFIKAVSDKSVRTFNWIGLENLKVFRSAM